MKKDQWIKPFKTPLKIVRSELSNVVLIIRIVISVHL